MYISNSQLANRDVFEIVQHTIHQVAFLNCNLGKLLFPLISLQIVKFLLFYVLQNPPIARRFRLDWDQDL